MTTSAGNGAYLIVSNSTGNTMLSPYSRAAAPSSSGAITVIERATVAGPRGSMAVGITSTLSGSNAARIAMRCVLGANPYCLAGSAALALLSMYRGTANPNGTIAIDQGAAPASANGGYKWSASGSFQCGGTVSVPAIYDDPTTAALEVMKGYPKSCTVNGQYETLTETYTYGTTEGPGGFLVTVQQTITNKATGETTSRTTSTRTLPNQFYEPAQTCPNGGSYSVVTGNCSTGTLANMTADQAADYIAGRIQTRQYGAGHNALAQAVDSISRNQPVPVDSVSLEVPPTIDGGVVSTTSVTNPDGSKSTTTTTRQFQLTSSGAQINVATKDTATTTTQSASGQTTGSSSVVTTTPTPTTGTGDGVPYTTPGTTTTTGSGTGTATPTPGKNQCETNPDSVGCLKLGEVPNDQIPKSTASVSYTKENLGLAASCPPGYTVLGHSLSFQPACDAMGMIRPMILAVAAVMAAMMCIAAVRGN